MKAKKRSRRREEADSSSQSGPASSRRRLRPLPQVPEPALERERTGAKADTGPSTRKKILIVDDHPLMLVGLTTLINAEPDLIVCHQARDAEKALSEISQNCPDLVITDMTMPGRGGLELIKDLKSLKPGLPVLVISMHDEMLHAERALRAGARGYLMKEAGGEKMLEAIRKVLSGHIYVSESISAKILDVFSSRRPQSIASPIEKLTDREFEIFQLIGQGQGTRAIARRLNLSSKTVDVHRAHIKEKLELPDATSLVRHAVRWIETEKTGN